QGTRLSSVGGHGLAEGLLGLAAAADRGGKGDYRVGLVSLRHRGEPADDRSPAPVYPRARTDRPPRQTGGAVRAEHATRHSAERGPARVSSKPGRLARHHHIGAVKNQGQWLGRIRSNGNDVSSSAGLGISETKIEEGKR